MTVRINILPYLRHFTNSQEIVEVSGNTVEQCLGDLIRQFPSIETMLFDGNGKLLDYVDIYVNGESAYPEELTRSVKDGDELHIVLIIGGG